MVCAQLLEFGHTVSHTAGRARVILITRWTLSVSPVCGSFAFAELAAVADKHTFGITLLSKGHIPMELAEIRTLLATWAAEKPLINRLWLFGSRVRGENRHNSDLDVAIELDMSSTKGIDESGGVATWAFDSTMWKSELEGLLSLTLDLQRYKTGETNVIHAGLDHSSILVHEKKRL